MKTVFLTGTKEAWRKDLIALLKLHHFDDIEADALEYANQRARADFLVHGLSPGFTPYDIARVTIDSIAFPRKTMILAMDDGLSALLGLLEMGGALVFTSVAALADVLNSYYQEIPFDPNTIQCLIERDGPTAIRLDGRLYTFTKNANGDYVCQVTRQDHRLHFLENLKGDFQIYQAHLIPDPEFTPQEWTFMSEWKLLAWDRFRAYVNGHTGRFVQSSNKVRRIAREKWYALAPRTTRINGILVPQAQQECPVPGDQPEDQEPVAAILSQPGDPICLSWDRAAWETWVNRWLRMDATQYREFWKAEEEILLHAPEDIFDRAEAKWRRLITDEDWPWESEAA